MISVPPPPFKAPKQTTSVPNATWISLVEAMLFPSHLMCDLCFYSHWRHSGAKAFPFRGTLLHATNNNPNRAYPFWSELLCPRCAQSYGRDLLQEDPNLRTNSWHATKPLLTEGERHDSSVLLLKSQLCIIPAPAKASSSNHPPFALH